MLWPLVSATGFVLAVVLVIVLGRARTARWERDCAATEERERRTRARQRARLAKSGLVAASTVRRGRTHGAHRSGRSPASPPSGPEVTPFSPAKGEDRPQLGGDAGGRIV
jgi:hypothetical protein